LDKKNSEKHVVYNNGAQLRAFSASKNGIRGFSPDILFIDEAAFLEYGEIFMKSANGSMSAGGQLILNSTPNGHDAVYYKTYEQAKEGRNNYTVVEINWYEDPRYNADLIWINKKNPDDFIEQKNPETFGELLLNGYRPSSSWYRSMCETMLNDPKTISQELENKFLGSGGQLIDEDTIKLIQKQIKKPIRKEWGNNMYIFADPEPDTTYIVALDVSKGTGDGDYMAMEIFKDDVLNFRLEQVAEFQGKISLDEAAEMLYQYATKYNNGYVVIDISGGWGIPIAKYMKSRKYENLHYDKPRENDVKIQLKEEMKGDLIPGFTVKNGTVRDGLVREFERRLREGEAIIYSERLLKEINTFVFIESKNRYDHTRSTHDDLIMASSLAFIVYVLSKSAFNDKEYYMKFAQAFTVKRIDDQLRNNKVLDDLNEMQRILLKQMTINNNDENINGDDNIAEKKIILPYIYKR
jgi:hypothetical protein